jgi:hypothetical protein
VLWTLGSPSRRALPVKRAIAVRKPLHSRHEQASCRFRRRRGAQPSSKFQRERVSPKTPAEGFDVVMEALLPDALASQQQPGVTR